MEPDRFDDVAFRMLEGPEPPRRPPRRPRGRWLLGAAAALLMTGALAAGASALTGGGGEDDASVTAAPKPRTNISYTDNGVPYARDGAGCRAGEHHGRKRENLPAGVKY